MALELTSAVDLGLVPDDATCERHLMLGARAPEGTARRLPINLALVLDTSGSMNDEKIVRAREVAERVVRHLTTVDRIAPVAYADRAEVIAPATALHASGRANLLYRLSRLEAEGSTNLSSGWLLGCHEVAGFVGATERGSICRALVLTNGLANVGIVDPEEMIEHARALRQRGVTTSTMGLGADFNEDLLEPLARHGGGRFQYVETAKHVPDCVQGEGGELAEVAARQVAIDVALPDGLAVMGCLNDYATEPTRVGVRVQLGDLLAGETRRVVLKLRVEARPSGLERAVAAVAYYIDVTSGLGTDRGLPRAALRSASATEVERQAPDGAVVAEVARLLAARARDAAAWASRAGEDTAAAAILASAGQALRSAHYSAAPTAAFEASALESIASAATSGLRESQRKELRYQSYLMREARRRYDVPPGKA